MAGDAPAINHELARSIVESAIRIYFRKRRSRVPRFVDETYSVPGSMRLHRHAIGHDLWRAPFNALIFPIGSSFGTVTMHSTAAWATPRWLRTFP